MPDAAEDEYDRAVAAAEKRYGKRGVLVRPPSDEEEMGHEGGAAPVEMPPAKTAAQAAHDAAVAAKAPETEFDRYMQTQHGKEQTPEPAAAGGFGSISYPEYPQGPKAVASPSSEEAGTGTREPSGGGGLTVVPGGFQPEGRSEQRKLGKPVPEAAKAAYGAAAGLELEGAGIERDARNEYYAHERDAAEARLAANEDAASSQRALQAKKDQLVQSKLAQIETLNKEAQGDPEDLWSDRSALASLIGVIMTAVGFAVGGGPSAMIGAAFGAQINHLVDRDIQSKLATRKAAGERADREKTLLDLHLDHFGDQSKAIEATRLGYYDNILQQMDMYRAEHAAQVSDAQFNQAAAQVLKLRADTENHIALQESDDIAQAYSERYKPPQVLGGGAGGADEGEPSLVVMSDGTAATMPTLESHNKAIQRIDAYKKLQRLNNEILVLRGETQDLGTVMGTEGRPEYVKNIKRLENLEETKLKILEAALQQGVLREGEYKRAKELTGHATDGLGYFKGISPWAGAEFAAANSVLRSQSKEWDEDQREMVKAAGGHIFERKFIQDPMTGKLKAGGVLTGQNLGPSETLPTEGFKAFDTKVGSHRQSPNLSSTTPYAPVVPGSIAAQAESAAKKRHRKK